MTVLVQPDHAAPLRPEGVHTSPIVRGWLRLQSRLDGVVARRGSLRAVALLRVLMGAVVIRHLWPDVRASVLPVERFHVPWWSWLPVPSPALYRGLLWLGVAAGAAMILGLAPRLATRVALFVVAYLLFVDMTGFAHNRGFLVWLLVGLSLLPTGGAFTLRGAVARVRHRWAGGVAPAAGAAVGPLWPLYVLRIVAASVYLTSGFTKLVNPDWVGGLVLWDRVVRAQHLIPFDGWLFDVLTSRVFYAVLAPTAVAIELFAAFALWFGRTRLTAVWLLILFHLSIELTASVQTFSYSALAALLLWATPATGDRVLVATPRMLTLVRRLDWLQRFRVESPPAASRRDTVLVDRDGTVRRGRDAELTALSRLPVLFPFVAPLLAAHRLRRRFGAGEAAAAGSFARPTLVPPSAAAAGTTVVERRP